MTTPSPRPQRPSWHSRRAVPVAIVRIGVATFRGLSRTWARVLIDEDGSPVEDDAYPWADGIVHAAREQDLLALASVAMERPVRTVIAPGRDGDWAAAALRLAGSAAHRAATGRADTRELTTLVREMRERPGLTLVSVDGPLGPPGVVKPGVVALADVARYDLRAVAAACSRPLRFPRTWSGLYLPAPFSTVVLAVGPRLAPDPSAPRHDRARRVQQHLQIAASAAAAVARRQGGVHARTAVHGSGQRP